MNFPRLLRTLLGRVALIFLFVVSPIILRAAETRILIYTKNQVGPGLYVHDNVASATKALQKLISDQGWVAEVSGDPTTFTPDKLKTFTAIIFNNTNNEILDNEAQKTALTDFVHNGGGIAGIHSACGSMRNWPWFWSLMGGKFKRHPKLQPFTVKVADKTDLSTAHLPTEFQWTDEFYFLDHMPEGLHILLAGDLNSLDDPQKPTGTNRLHPLSWRHEFEGGRVFFTALGHEKEHYEDSRLTKHILGGLLWVTRHNSKSN